MHGDAHPLLIVTRRNIVEHRRTLPLTEITIEDITVPPDILSIVSTLLLVDGPMAKLLKERDGHGNWAALVGP